jgi:HK97 family phage major capsid protein
MNDPGQYDRFARKNCEIKHDGKCIDVIYGIKSGKSEIQAYRYPKKTWTTDDARAHCKSHKGSFEAASESKSEENGMEILSKIKIGRQYRSFTIQRTDVDSEKRTVLLSFSSEEPVDRWWGREILDHKEKSVNLRRLKRGGALLIDHDMKNQVGVIEKVWIDEADRKGRAMTRFGRSAKAEEIFQDVLDEIRSNISVGYQVDELVLEEEKKGELSTYRVTKWEPYEISLVAVPADINVGIGRGDDGKEVEIKIPKREERKMDKCAKCDIELVEGRCPKCDKEDKKSFDVRDQEKKPNAVELEIRRKRAIENLCKMNKLDDRYRDMWIGQGLSPDEVGEECLKILEERGKTNPQPDSRIGLTNREIQRFSLIRAVLACVDKDWKNAPFELECSREVAKKLNKISEPTKFYIPFEVLERPVDLRELREKRDVSVGASGGGYLVSTDNIGFIEMLRNRSVAFRMGARRLSGLQGSVTIPRQSAAATAYWLTNETTGITESQQTFVQLALTPKNVGAYTEISRQLLLQSSPGAEGIVTDDLAQVVAIAADLAALNGSGGAQPTGIINTAGIGGVTGTSLAYAGIIEFQTDVASSNVTPLRGGYVTTPAVAGLLMARSRFTNTDTPLWAGNVWDAICAGFPGMSSAQMPTADMLFGDWQELVIGEWGVLEVEVNPYANFQAGIIGIRAIYTLDVGVRRPFAFSLATSIT